MSIPAEPEVVIRRGVVGDAAGLAAFAARTFAEAFGDATSADDLQAHAAATYRTDLQARELADPTVITLLALQDARIVAFAQVRLNDAPPPCVTMPDAVELQRFYADRSVRGTGLTSRLMELALDAARKLGGRYAWLGVWERNARAMAFYRKAGFDEIGFTHYMVGSDRQIDRVFLASLSPLDAKRAVRSHGRSRTGQT
ncbi:MAG: GNAT family N-acetyltransferase [Proteobacteria bacterium]|nr:GNAT family N-acetyltransferase [Pseudomonadota bacterium]